MKPRHEKRRGLGSWDFLISWNFLIGCLRQRIIEQKSKTQQLSHTFFWNIYLCIHEDWNLESSLRALREMKRAMLAPVYPPTRSTVLVSVESRILRCGIHFTTCSNAENFNQGKEAEISRFPLKNRVLIFWVLIFRVLVFRVLVFRVLVFRVLGLRS